MQGWAKTKQAAKYAGVSERTFRDWLRSGQLKYSKIPSGTVLVRFSEIDTYLDQFSETNDNGVKDIVSDVLAGLGA